MIGSALCNALVEQEYRVIAVVREHCTKLGRLKEGKHLEVISCNMDEYSKIAEKVPGTVDIAVALAWSGTRGQSRNDLELQERNYRYNIKLLEQCHRLGCTKFLTAGSQAEYGLWTKNEKLTETDVPDPNTQYGIFKLKFFEYATEFGQKYHMTLVEPRFFSLYGPDDYSESLIMSVLDKMKRNEPCSLTQCIQLWDFLYIDDAIRALMLLIESDNASGIYNLGYGESFMLKHYVEEMYQITKSSSKIEYGVIPYPETGMVNVNPDVSKLEKLGWRPETGFEEGIKKILVQMSAKEKEAR